MGDSVYKVIELIGTSTKSWEDAARTAVETAGQSLRDLRVAEISQLDMHLEDGEVLAYRAKVKVSFKYVTGEGEISEPAAAARRPAKKAGRRGGKKRR